MSTDKKNTTRKDQQTDTPQPQKQWDEMPGERTSDPEQQQIDRVVEDEKKKGPKGNAGEVASQKEQEKKDSSDNGKE